MVQTSNDADSASGTVRAGDAEGTRLEGVRLKVFLDRYSLKDKAGTSTEKTPEQMWRRVARGIAEVEATPEKRELWEGRFYEVMRDFKFVPGGRILAGAGTGHEVTYYNCFQGDTPVHTRDGVVAIGSLSGEHDVLSEGGVYRRAHFRSYGWQRLWKVALNNGATLQATGDHQWVVTEPKGGTRRVLTRDLKGHRIPINPRPAPDYDETFAAGVRHGIVFGDGSVQHGRAHICLVGESEQLATWFEEGRGRAVPGTTATKSHVRIQGLPGELKTELPRDDAPPSYWRGFVAGLIAADGHVDARGSVAIYNADATVLGRVADGMAVAGFVASGISLVRELSPFDGTEKPLYRLQLFRVAIRVEDLLLESHRRNFEASPAAQQSTIRVVDVQETDMVEEVFCCVEPETHTITVGHGYLTGQCYVIPSPEDSRSGILDNLKIMTEIMARGGGVGINLSTLRPRGSYIRTVNGTASGPCSWAELYSVATGDVIQQGGSRRGALMLMLDDNHPDIEEFITVKQDLTRINHANLSVCVSDAFMEAVKADADWNLVWKGEVKKTLKARHIWRLICEAAWRSAEPGLVFMDRYNNVSNTWYYEDIRCVNPCVTGETLVYTADGLRRAADLAADGNSNDVTIDGRFRAGQFRHATSVFPTGVKPVARLRTTEGYQLRLTADHQVMTERGWIAVSALAAGERVRILNRKGGFGRAGTRELGLVLGWLVGDGTFKASEAVLSFFGLEKTELAPQFAAAVDSLIAGSERAPRPYPVGLGHVAGRDEARVSSVRLARLLEEHGVRRGEKLKVPESVFGGSEEMQRAFLQALFTADGHVSGTLQKGASVRLTSVSQELLVDVQRLLLNFGVASTIYTEQRTEQDRSLPDGQGGHADYHSHACHDLVVSRDNLVRFDREIGFLTAAKSAALTARLGSYRRGPNRERFLATVAEVTPDGEEMVYDLTEPTTHSFVANGLVVHNCGEQGLPPWGVCNLGALNLSAFVRDGEMDFAALADTSRVAMRFLDNVVDANLYFIEENREAQLDTRRTGLGTMGLGDALIKLGVRYGSEESTGIVERIYRTIRDAAYDASADNAAEKGAFPRFDGEKYLKGAFIAQLPNEIRRKIAANGVRNAVLLTQAPTGTTSLLSGVSSGIEPVYDFAMVRRDRTGEHVIYHPLYQAWRDAHPGESHPDYFVGANDLTPEDHIRVQSMVQHFTDSSISKTVNAPNSHTVEDVERLYTLAYELGCKGVTYFRDGCREGVLSHLDQTPSASRHANGHATASASGHTNGNGATALLPPVPVLAPRTRPTVVQGYTRQVVAPEGRVNITLNSDRDGLLEVFVNIGRSGSDLMALAEALGRLISLNLQMPSSLKPEERTREIARQLKGIGGSRTVGFGPGQVRSLPDAISRALLLHLENEGGEVVVPAIGDGAPTAQLALPIMATTGNLCPECGCNSLVYEEGCKKCHACGHSEC